MGNALFIATSLAVIVASASGGSAGAIVLYETTWASALRSGRCCGALGEISYAVRHARDRR